MKVNTEDPVVQLIVEVRRLTDALAGTLALSEEEKPWPGYTQMLLLSGRNPALCPTVWVRTTETGLTIQIRNSYGIPVAQMTWVYEKP